MTPEQLERAESKGKGDMLTYLGAENYWPEFCKQENLLEGSPEAGWWGYKWAEFVSDKRAAALLSQGAIWAVAVEGK